ncbi:MAG: 23S rRNA (guanosine(2251)-2'-O)-methyltransferase RlmB [Clostridiales bacterium]|nr:23S rRNA (guanosine(2251)-2'-O)-methyltransferase RlmB [Clostridiales bacterium]
MDKGKKQFKRDRRPGGKPSNGRSSNGRAFSGSPSNGRPSYSRPSNGRPEYNREREDTAFASEGSTDKLEGRNAITEALAAGREFNKIWILKPEGDKPLDHGLIRILDEANKKGIIVTRATRQVLDKMSSTHNHQGVIASVAPHSYADLDEIISKCRDEGRPALLVALDEIKDAYNLGSILRISDCCGVDGVIIPERRSVALDSMVAKASAGAIEYVPVARVTNLAQTLTRLKEKENFWVCGTDMNADYEYHDADYSGNLVVVIGSEGDGMRDGVRKCCDFTVSIPMSGHVNSLNAAVAAGVVLFEAQAKRHREE